jgi:hypothetical protein
MLFVGLLSARRSFLRKAAADLADCFGPVAAVSPVYPFTQSDHYDEEFGGRPYRQFLFFSRRIHPGRLAGIKVKTNAMEARWSRKAPGGRRRGVNLDPGYLTLYQVVLATTKNFAHRIYLKSGIYAEVTLVYRRNRFQALEHTYPDFRSDAYRGLFGAVRDGYLR